MAEETELERSEPASPRRLEQAREQGQVARSRELSTFLMLGSAAAGMWAMAPELSTRLAGLMRDGLSLERSLAFDSSLMLSQFNRLATDALLACAPLFALLVLAALGAPLLLSGWAFSLKPIEPDFNRLDPFAGLRRMASVESAAELAKTLAKTVLVAGVAVWVIWHYQDDVFGLSGENVETATLHACRIAGVCFLGIVAGTALVAAADVPFQLWSHHRKLRMSREELRQEAKESEGDPKIKARIRAQQREIARRRMMSDVPKADVVVTNPTHYAVALRYEGERMRAPRVVAKGAHLLAARIRELAEAHRVPVMEAPPLARALYHNAEIGDEIPETLYTAVAEVLAYVFQLRRHREGLAAAPRPPGDLPVPPGLDPEGAAQ